MRWLARGVFECERCGEFPDFRHSLRERAPVKGQTNRSAVKS